MDTKSFNLTKDEDIDQWKSIKMHEINARENPDLCDIDVLREMMDLYEEEQK